MENFNFQIILAIYRHREVLQNRSPLLLGNFVFVLEKYSHKHQYIRFYVSKGKQRSRVRTKVMGIICLVLGVFLFVPGLIKPQELFVPLLAGAFAIIIGIVYLYNGRKSKKNAFDKSAKLLLMGKDNISAKQSIVVSFSESGMEIQADDKETNLPFAFLGQICFPQGAPISWTQSFPPLTSIAAPVMNAAASDARKV